MLPKLAMWWFVTHPVPSDFGPRGPQPFHVRLVYRTPEVDYLHVPGYEDRAVAQKDHVLYKQVVPSDKPEVSKRQMYEAQHALVQKLLDVLRAGGYESVDADDMPVWQPVLGIIQMPPPPAREGWLIQPANDKEVRPFPTLTSPP